MSLIGDPLTGKENTVTSTTATTGYVQVDGQLQNKSSFDFSACFPVSEVDLNFIKKFNKLAKLYGAVASIQIVNRLDSDNILYRKLRVEEYIEGYSYIREFSIKVQADDNCNFLKMPYAKFLKDTELGFKENYSYNFDFEIFLHQYSEAIAIGKERDWNIECVNIKKKQGIVNVLVVNKKSTTEGISYNFEIRKSDYTIQKQAEKLAKRIVKYINKHNG